MPVKSVGSTIKNALSDVVFTAPSTAASGSFTIDLVMSIAAAVTVVVSKSVALEGAENVATFPVCTFLVSGTTIFCAEEHLSRESWVSMDTLEEYLSGSYSYSAKSQKLLMSSSNFPSNVWTVRIGLAMWKVTPLFRRHIW